MSKICIIGVYLGTLPDTFPIWLKSVKFNKTIDFMLVTDAEVEDVPANLRIVKMTLEEVKQLAEQEMGMELTLDIPIKLCDYKPVYGTIFRKYLQGYDYWGHCDLDLMFGDLEKFFADYHLYHYAKFLHQGHLALYRNTKRVNSSYKLPGSYFSYKEVFASNDSFVFDEYNRINGIFVHNKMPLFEKTIFANINPAYTRFKCCGLKNYKKQLFYYDSGKIFRAYIDRHGHVQQQEFIYIHLLKRKLGTVPQEILDADRFAITENGYFVLDKAPDADMIREFTKDQDSKKDLIEAVADFRKNWLDIGELKVKATVAIWKVGALRKIMIKRKK